MGLQSSSVIILTQLLLLAVTAAFANDLRVVIIGAGSSGIAAASRLVKNGFTNVTLLEAEDRFGGRVNTIPFAGGFIDLGAQWCHGEKNNPSFELANPHNLLAPSILSTQNLRFAFPDGEQVDADLGVSQFRMLLGVTSRPALKTFEGRVGDFIEENYADALATTNTRLEPRTREGFLKYYRNFVLARTAMDDWNDDNGPGFNAYEECEGNQMLSWKGKGYVTVLKLLMETLPDPAKSLHLEERMVLGAEVATIEWDREDNTVLIRTSDGREFVADRVIFTPSLGVLKEQHESLFAPPLSGKKVDAINGLSMGAVGKVYFRFEAPFWPTGWGGVHILWTDALLQKLNADNAWLGSVMGFLAVDGQEATLSAWLAGSAVKHVELLDEQFVVAELIELLKALVPHMNVTRPVQVKRTQWNMNRHFRGTYSFRGINATVLGVSPRDLEAPVQNSRGQTVLQFAGEATNFNHYSTVHGAIETGWREAQRIIDEFHSD